MYRFNIVNPGRSYTGKDGKQKFEWNSLGKLAVFLPKDGKDAAAIVDWNTMPGHYEYNERLGKEIWVNPVVCFLQTPKEDVSKPKVETTEYEGNLYQGEIKDEDIPWQN